MRADVAFAERAVDGVGQRMQRRVGVGVALELGGVRDAHAAEPDGVAGLERMDVKAGADAGFHRPLSQTMRSARSKSSGMGELDVVAAARDQRDAHAGPLGDRGIVGEVARQVVAARSVRREDLREAKALRRLRGEQLSAGPRWRATVRRQSSA